MKKWCLNIKFAILLLLTLIFLSSASAVEIDVSINETSTLTQLLNGGYSLVADGTLVLHNPSNFSRVYEIRIPLDLDELIGINREIIDNSSNKLDFNFNEIKGYILNPNETITVGYHIFGILSYDVYSAKDSNESIFEFYSDDFEFITNPIINLQKPQREGFEYLLNGSLGSEPIGNTTRLISAGVRNPTDFSLFAKEFKLYKTEVGDPFFGDGQVIRTYNNISIPPFEFAEIDFFDTQSSDSSVYWLSSQVVVDYIIDSQFSTSFRVQTPPSGGGGGGGGSGGSGSTLINSTEDEEVPILLDSVLLKKNVDRNVVASGEEVTVFLRVVNVNNNILENLMLFDEVPTGYEIKDVSESVKIESGGKISFSISKVEEYETYTISYTMINKNQLKGITYLKPARLIYSDYEIFSEGVLLINDLLPDKKVFVQKEIEYVDDRFARVTIRVKNLGTIALENLLVSDIIDDNAIVKEISKMFHERGIWKINTLKAGEEWEVSYLIERTADLNTLPNVYGVERSNIYGTIIISEEIVTIFRDSPRTIEKVGITLAVGLLILYLLF